MKISILALFFALVIARNAEAQDIKTKDVPAIVKQALIKRYPNAIKVSWKKEKGNYEANWGGKSGEDTSVQFTPEGIFVEEADAVLVAQLPQNIAHFVRAYYNGAKIREASRVTDASGKKMFEAEIKGKDLLFDESGSFIKTD